MSAASKKLGWDQARPDRVVLISGREDFLAGLALAEIKSSLRRRDPDLEVKEIEAKTAEYKDLGLAASPSLFGANRLVWVRGVEESSEEFLLSALAYVEDPLEDCCLVLRHRGGVRGKKLLARVRSLRASLEVVCDELGRDSDKSAFAKEFFTRANKSITAEALRSLVANFGANLSELSAISAQLIQDTQARVIEFRDVEQSCATRPEFSALQIAEAVFSGRTSQAIALARQAQASGVSAVAVVAVTAARLRLIAKLKSGDSRMVTAAPWQIQAAKNQASRWSSTGLARCIQALAQTDATAKGMGKNLEYRLETTLRLISQKGLG